MRVKHLNREQSKIGESGRPINITFTGPLILSGDPLENTDAATKRYVDTVFLSLDASNLKTGILPVGRLPAFNGDVTNVAGSNVFTLNPSGVTAGTYAKVTVDSKGRVIGHSPLVASDIPSLDWGKITKNKPTTLAGYGITDGINLTGDSVIGTVRSTASPVNPGHAVTRKYIEDTAFGEGSLIPAGIVVKYATNVTPNGFLRCNGGSVSKSIYADLYAVIGDRYFGGKMEGFGKPWEQQFLINQGGLIRNSIIPAGATDIELSGQGGHGTPETVGESFTVSFSGVTETFPGGNKQLASIKNIIIPDTNVDIPLTFEVKGTEAYLTVSYVLDGQKISYTWPTGEANNGAEIIGKWTSDVLPFSVSQPGVAVTKNYVYVIGGYSGSASTQAVWRAPIEPNGTLGTWVNSGNLGHNVHACQVVVARGRVFVLGGRTNTASINTVKHAVIGQDGTLGPWVTGTPLPVALHDFNAFVHNNYMYVLGGITNTTYKDQGYIAQLDDNTGLPGAWMVNKPAVPSTPAYVVKKWNLSSSMIYSILVTQDRRPAGVGSSEPTTTEMENLLKSLGGTGSAWLIQSSSIAQGDNNYVQANSYPVGSTAVFYNREHYRSGPNYYEYYIKYNTSAKVIETYTGGSPGQPEIIYVPNLKRPTANSQLVVTNDRVYLAGGTTTGNQNNALIQTASINADGTLTNWTDSSVPNSTGTNSTVTIKGETYTFPGGNRDADIGTNRYLVQSITQASHRQVSLTIPQGGFVTLEYVSMKPEVTEYTTSVSNGKLTIPSGVTQIVIEGQGCAGTPFVQGRPEVPAIPEQKELRWQVVDITGIPMCMTEQELQSTLALYKRFLAGNITIPPLTEGEDCTQYEPLRSQPCYAGQEKPNGFLVIRYPTTARYVVTKAAVPAIPAVPDQPKTIGPNTTVSFNGQNVVFQGGDGGVATRRTEVISHDGTPGVMTINIPNNTGYVKVAYFIANVNQRQTYLSSTTVTLSSDVTDLSIYGKGSNWLRNLPVPLGFGSSLVMEKSLFLLGGSNNGNREIMFDIDERGILGKNYTRTTDLSSPYNGQLIVTNGKVHILNTTAIINTAINKYWTASIKGGYNDYSGAYTGGRVNSIDPDNFVLPDYTNLSTQDNIHYYVKY